MSMEELRNLKNAAPFKPFTILMKNGGLFDIESPLRIGLSPRGHVVSVFEGNHLRILEVSQMRHVQLAEGATGRG